MTLGNGRERSSHSANGRRPGQGPFPVSLIEVEPDLGPLLADEQLDQARGFRLAARTLEPGVGELVGAKRPTVSIALRELARRGSLIRQDEGWLILDPPPEQPAGELERPRLIVAPRRGQAWSPPAEPESRGGRLELLQAELARLRDKHRLHRAHAQDLADQAGQIRARTHELVARAHSLAS